MKKQNILFLCLGFCLLTVSCKKFMDIDPPTNSIVTEQVFADSLNANSAITGVYIKLYSGDGLIFSNGLMTLYCSEYADELEPFFTFNYDEVYYYNTLNSNKADPTIWINAYEIIYQLNLIIEGVSVSKGIITSTKSEMIAEAKFLRSLVYFYLINLYGDVPYVTSTVWSETAKTPRTPINTIYQNITADLLNAQSVLRSDYSTTGGLRTRANKWAATALLARIYLYQEQLAKAEAEANKVIAQNSTFQLGTDLNKVFEKSSQEAILQWNVNNRYQPYNSTREGITFVPIYSPTYNLTPALLNSFEANDQRRTSWIKAYNYDGKIYEYPYKYKNGGLETQPSAPAVANENYTVLRLAEQYLIRAEARAQTNNLNGAIDDINVIRVRAGLLPLGYNLTKDQTLAAIIQERRIEFFAEWGHRWLDLKRTGKADEVMAVISPLKNGGIAWQSYKKFWPIPQSELNASPFLSQNPGY